MLRAIHPSWCFYALVIGVIVGLILSSLFHLIICSHFLWLISAILLFGIAIFRPNSLTIILALLAGLVIANFRIAPELSGRDQLLALSGTEVTLSGRLASDPDSDSIRLDHLEISGQTFPGTIYVKLSSVPPDLLRSDQITLTGKLQPGFGTFAGSVYRPEIISITRPTPGDIFAQFKRFFSDRVRSYITSPAADLGLSYLIGDKSGLSDEFSEALRLVGMTHVVVASGTHLGIIVDLTRKIFGKISRFAGVLFAALMVLAFVCVVGFTPSMTRAALVTLLTLAVGYVGRRFTPFRLLFLVAALTLLIDPTNYLNLGWQLSFGSFFGILILAPRLTRFLYGGKNPPWLASMLVTSFATSLVCAPILIFNFGSFSLLGFIANLIILPTLPYIMLLVFLTGSFSFVPIIATILGKLATFLLSCHIWLVDTLSTWDTWIFTFPTGNPLFFLIYIPILAILLYNIYYDYRHRQKSSPLHACRSPELCS